MNRILTLFLCSALCVFVCACESKTSQKTTSNDAQASSPTQETGTPLKEAQKESTIEVSEKGTTFDPPIKIEDVPKGAYYCDMGTVHYARRVKGDGKCALCGMTLKHNMKGGASATTTHEGHAHGDHAHDEHKDCHHAECNHEH